MDYEFTKETEENSVSYKIVKDPESSLGFQNPFFEIRFRKKKSGKTMNFLDTFLYRGLIREFFLLGPESAISNILKFDKYVDYS